MTPNMFYQNSSFLFWLVVSIGSRKYAKQPTLTRALSLPVSQLALQSITVRSKPIDRIKGLCLLLNWPFPSDPFYRDASFLLGGSLIHMAMQCGLHVPSHSQDFSRANCKLPDQEPVRRAELWAYVVTTYQRYTKSN